MIYISLWTIFAYVNDDLNIERELNVPAWSDKGEHTQLKAFYYLTAASVTGVIGHFPGLVLEILLSIVYADFTRVSTGHMSRLKTQQKN